VVVNAIEEAVPEGTDIKEAGSNPEFMKIE
jgi:hypothetical protein